MTLDELTAQIRATSSGPATGPSKFELDSIRSNPKFIELTSIDGRGEMSRCGRLYSSLKSSGGEAVLRKVICKDWGRLSEMARINVCYAAYDADAMSVETALELFLHSQSGTHERHLIVAGLAVTEKRRHLGEPLYVLAAHIGTYDNPNRQRTLERFLNSVERQREKNMGSLAHAS